MIKQKAPKDMTAPEFVEHLKGLLSRFNPKDIPHIIITISDMERELLKPAPNPFTTTQNEVMREYQIDGFNYAAMDASGLVHVFKDKPYKDHAVSKWMSKEISKYTSFSFLYSACSYDDHEPLCFSDYAQLE